jgi:hypothetical protein
MDWRTAEKLLTEEERVLAKLPLEMNEKKRNFLRALLRGRFQVITVLGIEGVSPEELMVWLGQDLMFRQLYRYYESLVTDELVAATRSAAMSSEDLKAKIAVLGVLTSGRGKATKVTEARGRVEELETFGVDEEEDEMVEFEVRDPIAAVENGLIEQVPLPKTDVRPLLSGIPEVPQVDPAIGEVVRDALAHGKGTELVRFFRNISDD